MRRRTFNDLQALLDQGLDEEVQFTGHVKIIVDGARRHEMLSYQGPVSLSGYDYTEAQGGYHLRMGDVSLNLSSKLDSSITYDPMRAIVEIPLDMADDSKLVLRYVKDIKF